MDKYIENHAVNKKDVAFANNLQQPSKTKTGVAGKGRYKTWTPHMMLRVSFLGSFLLPSAASAGYFLLSLNITSHSS